MGFDSLIMKEGLVVMKALTCKVCDNLIKSYKLLCDAVVEIWVMSGVGGLRTVHGYVSWWMSGLNCASYGLW